MVRFVYENFIFWQLTIFLHVFCCKSFLDPMPKTKKPQQFEMTAAENWQLATAEMPETGRSNWQWSFTQLFATNGEET